jgi:2-polyprenyl-6-hydroxyphenyl methylase/3-demethylubiquinone-9 3-methyltransferase
MKSDSPSLPKEPSSGSSAYFTANAEGFRRQYDQRPEFKERQQVWAALLEKYGRNAKTAIDVGCGAGTFSFLLAQRGLSVTGVDGAPGMVALCKEQSRAHPEMKLNFLEARLPDLGGLQFPPADIVLSSSVLEYVPDLAGSLRKMRSLLRPGGHMFVSMPNALSLYRKLESCAYKVIRRPSYLGYVVHRLSAAAFTEHARTAGLRVLELAYYAKSDPVSRVLSATGFPETRCNSLFVATLTHAG